MKRTLLALMLSALVACGAQAQSWEHLGFSLLEDFSLQGQSALISPWGLAQSLNMAAEGAKGETLRELTALLGEKAPSPLAVSAPGVTTAAAALLGAGVSPLASYTQALSAYGAQCFQGMTPQAINDWARAHTRGLIDPLLSGPLPDGARLALLTAIALDAKWDTPFNPADTDSGTFHAPQGDVGADFMHRSGQMDYANGEGLQILRLPYEGKALTCYLILPGEGDMAQALKLLKDKGGALLEGLRQENVALALPRLSLDAQLDLSAPLARLGLSVATGDGADFSGIDGTGDLALGPVLQRTRLDLDEAGTRAASGTALFAVPKSALMAEPPIQMTLDRPFILLVREEASASLLFAACVLSPQ